MDPAPQFDLSAPPPTAQPESKQPPAQTENPALAVPPQSDAVDPPANPAPKVASPPAGVASVNPTAQPKPPAQLPVPDPLRPAPATSIQHVPPTGELDFSAVSGTPAEDNGPDPKRMKVSEGGDQKTRARSGRPNGVKCVCRCCGAQGFYQRSCGKKHQCLLGKCGTGVGGAWPGGPDMHATDANNGAVMYQVTCATCGTALQFALPDSPAYIVCYRCRAKMVIQPMPSDGTQPDGSVAEFSQNVLKAAHP